MPEPERRIRLEGPSYIEEGQNFFDQTPFGGLVEAATTKGPNKRTETGDETAIFSADHYRLGISHVVGKRYVRYSSEPNPNALSNHQIAQNMGYMTTQEAFFKHIAVTGEPFAEMKANFIQNLFQAIGDLDTSCPLWDQYVHTKRESAGYDEYGKYVRKKGIFVPEPTYPLWLTEQQARQRRGRMWGIQEIIQPQDPQEVARQTGARSTRRNWIIRNRMVT